MYGWDRIYRTPVSSARGPKTGSAISVNEQLTEELHKTVIENFKRRKVYVRFKDNIWAADLAEMESLPSMNKNFKYL